ncbi:MAG: hypothetical protein Kow0089_18680 [Desulfobulbaceae bacterium]
MGLNELVCAHTMDNSGTTTKAPGPDVDREMKKIFYRAIDFTKVDTLVYHLPDGPALSVEMDGLADIIDFEMEYGDICDTSDIDGVVHFFPRGNA